MLASSAPESPWGYVTRKLLPCWSSDAYHQLAYAALHVDGTSENVFRVNADGTGQLPLYLDGPDPALEPYPVGWFGFTQYDTLIAYISPGISRFYRVQADKTAPFFTNSLISGGPYFGAFQ